MFGPEDLQKSGPILTGRVHHLPRVREFEMMGEARNEENMYVKVVGVDACGLMTNVCRLMLGVGYGK